MNRKDHGCSDKFEGIGSNETTCLSTFRDIIKGEVISKQKTMNGYSHNIYLTQISNLNRIFMMVVLLKLLLLYLYVQFDLSNKQYSSQFLLYSNLCGVIASFVLLFRFQCKNHQFGLTDQVQETLFQLSIKILVIIIAPYGFLEGIIFQSESNSDTYSTKLNHLLTIVAFYKCCMFVGMIFTESQYMKPRAHRISKLYGSVSGSIFALRSIFKDLPFSFVFSVFTVSIFIFTFAFRVAESSVYQSSEASTIYLNMAWMTMITMTTVGYGDYAPRTPVGRIIGSLCVIWGGLFLSVTVVVVTRAFSMNKNQSQALRIISKLEHRQQLRTVAAFFIREKLWRVWTNYKLRLRKSPKMKQRKLQVQFKRLFKQQQNSFQCSNQIQLYNNLQKKFQGAFANIQTLTFNSAKLLDHLNERYFFNHFQWKKNKQSKIKVMVNKRRK